MKRPTVEEFIHAVCEHHRLEAQHRLHYSNGVSVEPDLSQRLLDANRVVCELGDALAVELERHGLPGTNIIVKVKFELGSDEYLRRWPREWWPTLEEISPRLAALHAKSAPLTEEEIYFLVLDLRAKRMGWREIRKHMREEHGVDVAKWPDWIRSRKDIGESHFRARFAGLGGVMDSFLYDRQYCVEDGIPCVVESAFCWRGEECEDERLIYGGVNWSAAIGDPFRSLGADGLGSILAEQRATYREPVISALHLAKARVDYKERGKSEVVLTGDVEEVSSNE